MSDVIRPLVNGAEMSDDSAIADDERWTLTPLFRTPFTLLDRCSKNLPKTAIFAIFREFGAACRRDGRLGKMLRHPEIGHDLCSAGPSQTEWV
jgi:hypothetical protein